MNRNLCSCGHPVSGVSTQGGATNWVPISGGVNISGSSTKTSIFRCNVSTEGGAVNGCQFWVESYYGSNEDLDHSTLRHVEDLF